MAFVVLLLLALTVACARPSGERVLGEQATPTPPLPTVPVPALPTPSNRSTGASSAPDGTAQAAVEGVAAEATGVGELTVMRFDENPAVPPGFATNGFFGVATSPGSALGMVTVTRCQVAGGLVYWWDGAAWRLASQQAFDRDTGCVEVGITGATAPSLAHLAAGGVALVLGAPPRVFQVDPSAGPPGTQVTISGESFAGANGVSFGTTAAPSFRVESDTRVVAEAPPGGGTVEVIVTTPADSSPIGGPTFTYR